MAYEDLVIAQDNEWQTTVLDARNHAIWSRAYGRRLSGAPTKVFWHHSVYPVQPLEPDEQLAWLVSHIDSGSYGWPYNFLVWPGESGSTIWYLNDVDEHHAHTYGHNAEVAICAHGNYETDVPPDHLVAAMWHLTNALMVMWGEDLEVLPHRAVYATACPGIHLVQALQDLVDGSS